MIFHLSEQRQVPYYCWPAGAARCEPIQRERSRYVILVHTKATRARSFPEKSRRRLQQKTKAYAGIASPSASRMTSQRGDALTDRGETATSGVCRRTLCHGSLQIRRRP